jgi:putative endonuclease
MIDEKHQAYQWGLEAEDFVVSYFKNKGFALVKKRYKTPHGEIDLIVSDKAGTFVFAEVKARKSKQNLLYTISEKQKKRILNACLFFLQTETNLHVSSMRFDALFVVKDKGLLDLEHIENAWDGSVME